MITETYIALAATLVFVAAGIAAVTIRQTKRLIETQKKIEKQQKLEEALLGAVYAKTLENTTTKKKAPKK